jgi:hypothetical protein
MPDEKPSHEFERAVLETSALLITLLFIMLQLGESWRDPAATASLSVISFSLAFAAGLAVINMGFELEFLHTLVLRIGEIGLMLGALVVLAHEFYLMATRAPGYAQVIRDMIVMIVGAMVIASVVLFLLSRRWRRTPQSSESSTEP